MRVAHLGYTRGMNTYTKLSELNGAFYDHLFDLMPDLDFSKDEIMDMIDCLMM